MPQTLADFSQADAFSVDLQRGPPHNDSRRFEFDAAGSSGWLQSFRAHKLGREGVAGGASGVGKVLDHLPRHGLVKASSSSSQLAEVFSSDSSQEEVFGDCLGLWANPGTTCLAVQCAGNPKLCTRRSPSPAQTLEARTWYRAPWTATTSAPKNAG